MGGHVPTAVFTDSDGLLRGPDVAAEAAEAAARRTLRTQIALLESELAEAFVTLFEMRLGAPAMTAPAPGVPRLLDLGELEQIRDALAGRLHDARAQLAAGADEQARKRELLARMQLEPGHYRFTRISCRELGEPGCGVWQVRPRLGLVGMLMGWWHVTLSSGCPLAGDRGRRRTPTRSER
jgi:hypothetical protein